MGKDFLKVLQKEKDVDEIWMIARRRERLEAIEAKGNGKLRAVPLDLSDMESFVIFERMLF